MSEMVEIVARALAWERTTFWIHHDGDDRIAIIDREWPKYVKDARAAIAALREPTEGMVRAGERADWVGEVESRAGRSIVPATGDDRELAESLGCTLDGIWVAMCDAALGETL